MRKGTFGLLVLGLFALAALVIIGFLSSRGLLPLFTGHWLDALMGALALVWLLVLIKAPWDLYFEARRVLFEMARSKERGVPVVPGREGWVSGLSRKLLWLSLLAHLGSAALMAALARFSGPVGWWFAGFYLLSTGFRPALSGYRHFLARLHEVGQEVRYPREDVLTLTRRVEAQGSAVTELKTSLQILDGRLQKETAVREAEDRDQREKLFALTREMEKTVARLTDNQEVIKGVAAFVRLIREA